MDSNYVAFFFEQSCGIGTGIADEGQEKALSGEGKQQNFGVCDEGIRSDGYLHHVKANPKFH